MATEKNQEQSGSSSPLQDLARQVERYRDQAEILGKLQAGRQLLECPSCGLHEDELADLSLIVAAEDEPGLDTGLRFAPLDAGSEGWSCPGCGMTFE
ncbi:MAG: hypothetical protein IPK50_22215 [Fibrobacterota bacterium]|nr:MAG: hypothetical protein IPK50_22215 [Fibrobacterota bacterium]